MILGRHMRTALFALLIAFSSAAGARTDLIADQFANSAKPKPAGNLDQHNTVAPDSSINGGANDYYWQQGITAGMKGQLTKIALYAAVVSGEEAATEVSVTLGAPWQTDAAAWSITTVLHDGWNTFDLTAAKIAVAEGDQYVIGIHGQSWNVANPFFGISYGDQYMGGDLWMNGTASGIGNDLLFRTYVKPGRVK